MVRRTTVSEEYTAPLSTPTLQKETFAITCHIIWRLYSQGQNLERSRQKNFRIYLKSYIYSCWFRVCLSVCRRKLTREVKDAGKSSVTLFAKSVSRIRVVIKFSVCILTICVVLVERYFLLACALNNTKNICDQHFCKSAIHRVYMHVVLVSFSTLCTGALHEADFLGAFAKL